LSLLSSIDWSLNVRKGDSESFAIDLRTAS
jgi:hypothetical protein